MLFALGAPSLAAEPDGLTALTPLLEKANDGDVHAMYDVALALIERPEDEYRQDGFGWALNAARLGHINAAELTGRLYRTGNGTKQNYVKARKWLYRARKRGSVGAEFELALLFSDEKNPGRDFNEADIHMQNALNKGEPRACLIIAQTRLKEGMHIRKVLSELNCAASGGMSSAMIILSDYLSKTRSPNAQYKALYWLRKAAEAGNLHAIERLEQEFHDAPPDDDGETFPPQDPADALAGGAPLADAPQDSDAPPLPPQAPVDALAGSEPPDSPSLGDAPLGDAPLEDTSLGDAPLGDTPLEDTPLGYAPPENASPDHYTEK